MGRTLARTALAAVVVLFLAGLPARAADPQVRDLTPMFRDGGVVGIDGLTVLEVGGIVVIRGVTSARDEAAAAGEFATNHGFKRVANLIQITEPVDDAALQRAAERQLSINGGLDGCKVRLTSHNGIIHIAGQVRQDMQKEVLVHLLRQVDGVRGVKADLTRF